MKLNKKKKMKKRIICLFIVMLLAVVYLVVNTPVQEVLKQRVSKENKTNLNQSEIAQEEIDISTATDVSSKYIDTSEYTQSYINYQKLSDEEKSKVAEPMKYKVKMDLLEDEYIKSLYSEESSNKPKKSKDKGGTKAGASSTDASYDLRNDIGSLNIEDQGSSNLCWAYGANKALETNVKKSRNQTYDYSETYWDYMTSTSGYGYRRSLGGAGWSYDVYQLMSANGAVTESVIPNNSSYSFDTIKQAEKVTRVTQYIVFPYVDKSSSDSAKQSLRSSVKSHIIKYGAVNARTNGPQSYNGYNSSTYAYCSSVNTCDSDAHIMTIIGWDDNFSKDNFSASGSNKPQNNGAWLVANSWGTWWGNGGYLWISYEDPFISENMMGIISSQDMYPWEAGYTVHTYYPNDNLTLKPGTVISDVTGSNDFRIQFDRKSKGTEYLDYVVVIGNGSTTVKLNSENNSLDGQYSEIGSIESEYSDGKDWLVHNLTAPKRLTGNSFALQLYYRRWSYNDGTEYGLCSADQIGGHTYKKNGSSWDRVNYNPQVIVYTHSYNTIDISSATVTLDNNSYTYDGTAKTPYITVKDGTKTLQQNVDYTVSYSNNTNVGAGTVTITGIGTYTGTITKNFKITPKSIANMTVSLNNDMFQYDGTAKRPSVTVRDGTKGLTSGTDYTVTYSNNTNVGTATATITGKGNYTGSVQKQFTIQSGDITKNSSGYNGIYDGQEHGISVNVTNLGSGATIKYGTKQGEYNLTENPKYTDAGTYEIFYQITASGYNTIQGKETVIITAKDINSITIDIESAVYDGEVKTAKITIKDGQKELEYKKDYNYVADSNIINAGTYEFNITGTGNYNGSISKEFKVKKANPSFSRPSGLVVVHGKTLEDVKLPENFTWEDELNTPVGEIGENTFKCTYTPTDTNNYNTITDIEVTLRVNEKLEVEVEDYTTETEDKIVYINDIEQETSYETLKDKIVTNGEVHLYNNKGQEVENETIKTGMKIEVKTELEKIDYILVVKGDLTGDGKTNGADLLKLARYLANLDKNLKGAYYLAANVHKTENDMKKVNNVDLLKIARVISKLDSF